MNIDHKEAAARSGSFRLAGVAVLALVLGLTGCATHHDPAAEDHRARSGPGPGMRSLCQDPALLWPCPESHEESESQERAAREALRR